MWFHIYIYIWMYICLEGSVHAADFIVGCVGSGACVTRFAQPFIFLSCGTVLACHILDFATSAWVRVKYYFEEKKRGGRGGGGG